MIYLLVGLAITVSYTAGVLLGTRLHRYIKYRKACGTLEQELERILSSER